MNTVLEDHDVLLTPGTATPPPRIGQLQGRGALVDAQHGRAGWSPTTACGTSPASPPRRCPPASAPTGCRARCSSSARPNDEATLLSLAAQIEAERPWAQQRPPEFS